jgi:hypothetical protein
MASANPVSLDDRALAQRARVRTMQQRRRRLLRRVLTLLVVTVAMVLAILMNRDAQELRAKRKQGETIAAALQQSYDLHHDPPLSLPAFAGANTALQGSYYFNIFYASQQESSQRAGVCCLRQPLRFFVRGEGRIVVLFDGERFTSQWMPESEFRAAARALGFGSLIDD